MAYFECLHEVKLIVDLIYEGGIANMRYSISNNAEYGTFHAARASLPILPGRRCARYCMKYRRGVRPRIYSGKSGGRPMLKASRRLASAHQIETVGAKLREMMPWIRKNKLVDQAKN